MKGNEPNAREALDTAILESALDAIIGMDALGVVFEFNRAAEELFGYSRGEVIGRQLAELIVPPGHRDKHRRGLARFLETGKTKMLGRRLELHGMRSDGEQFPVEITVIRIERTNPPLFLGFLRDISERVRAARELEESRAMYRDLYDNAPDMYVSVDARTARIVECNATILRKLRYCRTDLLGRPIFDIYHEDSMTKAEDAFRSFLESGEIRNAELQLVRRDGEPIDVILNASAIRDERGEILRSRSILRDITRRKSDERLRARLERQLHQSQKMEAVGELASGVAHDFRNLLTVIAAHTDRVKAEVCHNDRVLESLETMEQAVQHASTVTRSLLTFARRLPTNKVPTNLCSAIEDTTRMIERTLPATIEIDIVLPDGPGPWIEADETQLQQILLNLTLNAGDAMPDGGRLTIEVRCPGGNGRASLAQLVVSDTGHGIAPELVPRIFDPFFTTKDEERGTGLGLSTVHGIVESHGAKIEVESSVGVGTTFIVSFPRIPDTDAPGLELEKTRAPGGKGETILLAEDNRQVRQILAATLVGDGYEVVAVSDGEELLERRAALGDDLDLMILDVDLPKRSGLDALQLIRADGVEVPALVISTGTGRTPATTGDERTFYLPKPFTMTELGVRVHELLDERC